MANENNFEVIAEQGSFPIKHWTKGVQFEDGAKKQLANVAKLPFIFRHIAVCPDVHAGIGSVVGSVIPTEGAIVPAFVGVDIGCFAGETLIPLIDGKDYPISELAKLNNTIYIWAISAEGKVIATEAKAKLTKKNTRVIKIILDNKKEIICTPDQKFMLRNGNYLEADNLIVGTSLMPFYSISDKDGYLLIRQNYSGHAQRAHWIIARSGLLGEIPRFENQITILHHVDFNKINNNIDNLIFMGNKDHSAYHRSIYEKNTYWQSKEFEEKRIAALRAKAKTEEGYLFYRNRCSNNMKKYFSDENNKNIWLEKIKDNGKHGAQYLIKYNQSEKGAAKSKEVSNRIFTCYFCGENIKSPGAIWAHYKREHSYYSKKDDGYNKSYYSPVLDIIIGDGYGKPGNNHKVLRIEEVNITQDVYCLQVPIYNNFAISAGVFVHNCGMMAAKTDLKRSDLLKDLSKLRHSIEENLPHGRSDNGGRNDVGAWKDKLPDIVQAAWMGLEGGYKNICKRNPGIYHERVEGQLGTMGTGNHMCEISVDPEENIWILLHSGSRGPGAKIAAHFISLAKKEMNKWFIKLPGNDFNLSYFPEGTDHFGAYLEAVSWAGLYATASREIMMEIVLKVLRKEIKKAEIDKVINCHHNYVTKEKHFGQQVYVTRKGAISARLGEFGIIPGSMGDKTYIVQGLGNRESFYSASHGAGRMMSRTEATKTFSIKDHIAATEGVECKKDSSVIDETPRAYKPIADVIAAQKDLVIPVTTIKQILCIKG